MFAVVSVPVAIAAICVYGLSVYRRHNPEPTRVVLSSS
jgi:hypothetical protein